MWLKGNFKTQERNCVQGRWLEGKITELESATFIPKIGVCAYTIIARMPQMPNVVKHLLPV